ncbi:e3 ubiquitin-protein ligase RNF13 [Trichonephila clavipes]|nr:e3 ubiquitin-protein ligase RNF13 [Trichonephila clavipes]
MDWWTCSKIPGVSQIVAAAMYIHATRFTSELMGMLGTMYYKAPKRKNGEEINQGIWEGVNVYCTQWHPIPSNQFLERFCRCKANAGLRCSPHGLHTLTRLPSLLRLNLDSSLKPTWFYSAAVQFPRARTSPDGVIDGWASRSAHVMSAAIPNVLQPDAFVWFEKTQGSLMKVLPEPGWWSMKQLAVLVHLLRSGGLLDDWSLKNVLSLFFV